jgi:hypothetical protein
MEYSGRSLGASLHSVPALNTAPVRVSCPFSMRARADRLMFLASILRGSWRGLGLIPSYVAGW